MARIPARLKAMRPELRFGQLVQRERERDGLSQTELAEKIGRNQSWMSKFERGEVPLVSLTEDDISALCYELRISEETVFELTGRRLTLGQFDGRRVYLGGVPELYLYFSFLRNLDFIVLGDYVYALSTFPPLAAGEKCYIANTAYKVPKDLTYTYGQHVDIQGVFEVLEVNLYLGHLVKPLGESEDVYRVPVNFCHKVVAEFWLDRFSESPMVANFEASIRIGNLVRQRRSDMGLSQGQVASMCGRSQSWVSFLEKGETLLQQLPFRTFQGLLQSVGLSIKDLEALVGVRTLVLDLGSVESVASQVFNRFDSYLQNLVDVTVKFRGSELLVFEKRLPTLGAQIWWDNAVCVVENLTRDKVQLRNPEGKLHRVVVQRLPVLVVQGMLWELDYLNLSFDGSALPSEGHLDGAELVDPSSES